MVGLEPVLLLNVESTAPIAHTPALRCSADAAFATYVGAIAEWWDPRYTANADTLQAVNIEPLVGGRVYATHSDLGGHDWGVVTVWEPRRRLVHTFTLAQEPEHAEESSATGRSCSTGSLPSQSEAAVEPSALRQAGTISSSSSSVK